MKKARAIFECDSVMDYGGQLEVTLSAFADGGPENKRVRKYSPIGKLKIYIDNAELFKPGSLYHVDITAV